MKTTEWLLQNAEEFEKKTLEALLGLAARTENRDIRPSAPVREVFGLLGDKWSKLIMMVLHTGELRFSLLKRTLEALAPQERVSQRMLTLSLRSLERDGLVVRTLVNENTSHVEYSLSSVGLSLIKQVEQLMFWLDDHTDYIESARKKYESEERESKSKKV